MYDLYKYILKGLAATALASCFGFTNTVAPGALSSFKALRLNPVQLKQAQELANDSFHTYVQQPSIDIEKFEDFVSKRLPRNFKSQSLRIARSLLSAANTYQLNPLYLLAMIQTESSFNPLAVGNHKEVGLFQIRPKTAHWIARKIKFKENIDLTDPVTNIKIGAAYISYLRQRFDNQLYYYTAAYNMGTTNVLRHMAAQVKPRIYPERIKRHYIATAKKLALLSKKSSFTVASNP